MENTKIKQFVQEWIDSHEPDTFIKNENGIYLYTYKGTSLNLAVFFEDLLEDYLSSLPSTEERKSADEILSKYFHSVANGIYSCQCPACIAGDKIKMAMEEYANQRLSEVSNIDIETQELQHNTIEQLHNELSEAKKEIEEQNENIESLTLELEKKIKDSKAWCDKAMESAKQRSKLQSELSAMRERVGEVLKLAYMYRGRFPNDDIIKKMVLLLKELPVNKQEGGEKACEHENTNTYNHSGERCIECSDCGKVLG